MNTNTKIEFFTSEYGTPCVKVTSGKHFFVMAKSEWEAWNKMDEEYTEMLFGLRPLPDPSPAHPLDGFTFHIIEYEDKRMTAWANSDKTIFYEFTGGHDWKRKLDLDKIKYIRAARPMDI